jgi:aerobic C4-dicarboxylate transport protein
LQVLTAIAIGVALGHFYPEIGEQMKPLGDAFIKLIKMVIAPIIFCTVVHGIASMQDMKKVGRVGLKSLIYFEVLTTIALIVGLIVMNALQPGAGMNVDVKSLDTRAIQGFVVKSKEQSTLQFLMDIIPNTVVGAFAQGEILQVLFFAILFAFGLQALGERGKVLLGVIDQASYALFGVVGIIMKAAPIGAFGAMAFTIGKYGVVTLLSLAKLMAAFYTTCIIFIVFVLGFFAWLASFNIFKFIRYIKEELLIVLGTSSSESVLPRMIAKMENLGCEKSVVGLVIPTGYSFNLDGTCIYLTMAALFLAQATNTELSLLQQARHHRHPSADLQGRRWRDRLWLHRACRNTRYGRHDPGCLHRAYSGCRPVHVGSACTHQLDRQWRRYNRNLKMGRRAQCPEDARASEQ